MSVRISSMAMSGPSLVQASACPKGVTDVSAKINSKGCCGYGMTVGCDHYFAKLGTRCQRCHHPEVDKTSILDEISRSRRLVVA
jgi:hypothetical protein